MGFFMHHPLMNFGMCTLAWLFTILMFPPVVITVEAHSLTPSYTMFRNSSSDMSLDPLKNKSVSSTNMAAASLIVTRVIGER